MPGIARFRKKAKIGEFKPLDHFPLFLKDAPVRLLLEGGVDKNQAKEQNIAGQKNQKQLGFSHNHSHRHPSSPFNFSSVTSLNLSINWPL
jgi:hypothetical protein